VALITGAGGTRIPTAALAEAKCRVIAASRNIASARRTAARLGGAQAGRHLAVAIDYFREASINRGFASALKQAGQVDILVNNGHELLGADWRTVTAVQFNRQLANATGYSWRAWCVITPSNPAPGQHHSGFHTVMLPRRYRDAARRKPAAYQTLKAGIITSPATWPFIGEGSRAVNCLSPDRSTTWHWQLIRRLNAVAHARMGKPHEVKGAGVPGLDAASYDRATTLVDGGWTAW
jgi:NAD(P)-dependent dehydrogenase (short-subunit alcohol dehydrogenase family)